MRGGGTWKPEDPVFRKRVLQSIVALERAQCGTFVLVLASLLVAVISSASEPVGTLVGILN